MARPIKDGVDYFPMDVHLDTKFDLIEAEFGLTGFAVVVKLYQEVYGRGYYCEWTSEVALLFGRKVGLGGNVVSEIVAASIRRGIFNRALYEKYRILTSAGIQKRYFEAVSRRRCVTVDRRYLLVDIGLYMKDAAIRWVNVGNNPENEDNNSQTKGKERKEEKRKEDDPRARAMRCITEAYEASVGMMPRHVADQAQAFLSEGMEPELIAKAIGLAAENNVRKWSYAAAILRDCERRGIRTLREFAAEKEHTERRKRNDSDAAACAAGDFGGLSLGEHF